MQAQGYRIAENHRLAGVPPERVSEEWKSGGAGYWLDIQGDCHEVLEHYLGDIEIDPILLQLCDEDIEEIARVIPTDGAIFFGLPVSTGADDEPIGYLSALCLPRLLITLHAQPLPSLQEVADMLERTTGRKPSPTPARWRISQAATLATMIATVTYGVISVGFSSFSGNTTVHDTAAPAVRHFPM